MLTGYYQVLVALILIAVAVVLSLWQRARLEKDLLVATVRAFVQLVAIGYALEFIFDLNHPLLILLTIVIMMTVGAHTAAGRVKEVPSAFGIALLSISLGTFLTIGLMLLTRIISTEPKYVIPLAGMTIGNCMNAATLGLERIHAEIVGKKEKIEAILALGASSRQASLESCRVSVRGAMTPIVNIMKVIGLVQLPGAMTGMILAGASPVDAVRIQIVVVYMLASAVGIASLSATRLSLRSYFTKFHQLQEAQ
ncbi:MAG: hypothetical protein AMJ41_03820 [candidate division Zixibacteria bacterium DG_27]|nr:MAG: hypothetical protein AMJ41_03820 [candidate division Zixibacteria bacterium DG_27]